MEDQLRNLTLCAAVLAIVVIALRRHSGPSSLPGPPQIPLLGTYLPLDAPWETIRQYSLRYGPVIPIRILSVTFYAINTVSSAAEFFENRSSIYSQRIAMKMPELCGMNDGVLYESDIIRLRQARRLVASGVSPRELEKFRPQARAHVINFLGHLLKTPEKFLDHIRNLTIGMLLEINYGYHTTSIDDPFIIGAETLVNNYANASAISNFVVNWVPFLADIPEWFPGAGFQRTARAWRDQADEFTDDTYQYVVKQMAEGTALPSVVSKALEAKEPYDKGVIAKSAMQMVTGGADTTICATATFFLAMVLHPEVQKKAQAEIDQVVGRDRLPVYSDRSRLPYVDAVMKEVLRWHPPVPMIPRHSIQDDVYEGYFIPAGSSFIINVWAMLHNEEAFPDHMAYRPERWLDLEVTKEIDPFNIAFGFGRRECPGRGMAVESMFTTFANVLAVFEITKALDAHGNEITPSGEFTNGSISSPVPFQCHIKPRSPQLLSVLHHSLDD